MHRKIVVIDRSQVFLGSANLTTQSLKMHDNLVVGLYHTELARFLKNCPAPSFSFSIGKQEGELWLLPDTSGAALQRVVKLINAAQKKIFLAIFTLTHPTLTEALIAAHQRGVDVRIAIDFYTARGASLKALKQLEEAGIPFYSSQGHELLHHKWAWIDSSTLIFGSANWTQAAFTHNEDCFMILRHLSHKQKRQIKKIWNVIEKESI
jgi:phosphatidylserine/phosphatidylglycerophosphate/cardiolipin synthase-like enzyme